LKDNFDFILEIVKSNGFALQYASDNLKKNFQIVKECIKYEPITIKYSRVNKVDFRELLKFSSAIFKYYYLFSEIKSDFEIALIAVKGNGLLLEFLNISLRDDFDIVIEAVRNNGYSIRFASYRLRQNYLIILESIKSRSDVFNDYLEYCNNPRIVYEAVKGDGALLSKSSLNLKDNFIIVLESVKNYPLALEYASQRLKQNYEIIYESIKNNYSKENLNFDNSKLSNYSKNQENFLFYLKCFIGIKIRFFDFGQQDLIFQFFHFTNKNKTFFF
jgi:hypothetical protein